MFKELDPLLHSELRLGIMSILISVDSASFTYIREKTGATAGNLSVQVENLRKAGYIDVEKGYSGRTPLTTCKITSKGKKAFERYIEAIKSYLIIDDEIL